MGLLTKKPIILYTVKLLVTGKNHFQFMPGVPTKKSKIICIFQVEETRTIRYKNRKHNILGKQDGW